MTSQSVRFSEELISPPGDTILDLIEERDWSQAELALRLGISAKHLNQLIKGKVSLSHEVAQRLERVLGSTANFWINREANYRQQLARLEAEKQYENWSSWLDEVPLRELKEVGVISYERLNKAIKPTLVETLLAFFGVASPEEWSSHYGGMQASFRRSMEAQSDTGAIASWLRLGEVEAEKMSTPKYNRAKFMKAVREIRELTVLPPEEFEPVLRSKCHDAGVKFVLVRSIPRARVSGVARWLNAHSPLIQLSVYGKWNDRFWFTFFHEAAHILFHSEEKSSIFLDELNGDIASECEAEANDWASEMLIPSEFKLELASLRSEGEIIEFAERVNIHPGIVVGRLQHDCQIPNASTLNGLKARFEIRA